MANTTIIPVKALIGNFRITDMIDVSVANTAANDQVLIYNTDTSEFVIDYLDVNGNNSVVRLKTVTTANTPPSSLAASELAINITDKTLYSSNGTSVFRITGDQYNLVPSGNASSATLTLTVDDTELSNDSVLVVGDGAIVSGNSTVFNINSTVTSVFTEANNTITVNNPDGSNTSFNISSLGDVVSLTNNTESSNTSTGALVVSGGVAVTKNLRVSGSIIGNVSGTVSDISNFTTTNLAEGTNLYYTTARANSAIDARVTKAFVDALNVDADTIDGLDSLYLLDFNNATNVPDPTITLSGDVSGSGTLTNLANGNIVVTVADDSHNHIISNVDGLQANLDSKADDITQINAGVGLTGSGTLATNTTISVVANTGVIANTTGIFVNPTYITGLINKAHVDGLNVDADTIDGLDSLYLLDFNNATNVPDPTITLSGDASGTTTLTNLANGNIVVTVADDSHNHIISNIDGLQANLDSKADDITQINAGVGLTGSGTLATNTTISVVANTGVIANTTGIFVNPTYITGLINKAHVDSLNVDADTIDGLDSLYLLDFNNATNVPDPTITLSGDASGTTTLTNLANGTIAVSVNSVQPNSVALGTDTSGNYVRTIAGTANEIEISGSGTEDADVIIGLPNTVSVNSLGVGNTAPVATLQVDETGLTTVELTTTATTADQVLDSFDATVFRSVEYLIQCSSTLGKYQLVKMLLIHDGTTVFLTEYGEVLTGASVATFDADISLGNVRLLVTPADVNSATFKVSRKTINI